MSEQIYTIKEQSLIDLFDGVRGAGGYVNNEEKPTFSLQQILELLEEIEANRKNYVDVLNKEENAILFIPREMMEIPYEFLGTQYSWVPYLKWDKPRGNLILNNWAFANGKLIEIEIPSEVISMGTSTFENNSKLIKAQWNAKQISSIPAYTFKSCKNLEEIIFSEEAQSNITSIGEEAFRLDKSSSNKKLKMNFNSLINLTTLGNNAFYKSELSLIDNEGNDISKLIIPRGLTDLPAYAFADCGFTEVFFPNTYLGTSKALHIFYSTPLETVEFEEGLVDLTIPDCCFQNCPLKNIINSECIKVLNNSCFYGAGTENSLIEEFINVEEIGFKCFSYSKFSAMSLPKLNRIKGVGGANKNFFASKIKTLTFGTDFGTEKREEGASYYYITDSLFEGSDIDTIKFLGTIEEWCSRIIAPINKEKENWTGWPFAKTITYEDSTTSGGRLFVYNKNKELVEFKGTSDAPFEIDVETINANVFADYKNFGYVKFSNKLKEIKENAFKNIVTVASDEIHFDIYPYQYLEINFENEFSSPYGENALFSTIKFNDINSSGKTYINTLIDKIFMKYDDDGNKIYQTNLIIPAYAFAYTDKGSLNLGASGIFPNRDMEKIVIGEKAFYMAKGCTQTNFGVAQQVIIKDQAFYGVDRLNAFRGISGRTSPNAISIGVESFYNCSSLKVTITQNYPFSLPIIKTIGDRAFYGCTSLVEVVLGSENNPVDSIGADAFAQCTGITKITIYYDNSLYTEDTFNTMLNYPWGLGDTITIEGIGTEKTTTEE